MKRIIIFLLLIILTGCSHENDVVISDNISEALPLNLSYNEIYNIYIKNTNSQLSLYEPDNGCYLGAYILSDRRVAFNISNFENMTGKSHAVYIYHITPNDAFPLKWFMECISKNKTPFFILTADVTHDFTLIENFSYSLAKYKVPVFLEINPYSENKGYNEKEYIDFFRKTSDIVRKNAPHTAILWGSDINSVYTADKFYPGDSYIDWTALSIFEEIGSDNTLDRFTAELDYFYQNYQNRKPIFISQLCVSHFTSYGHEYQNKNAAAEIKRLYSSIINKYPQIKGVSYMDFNGFEITERNDNKEDFCITDAPDVLDAYSAAVREDGYLSALHTDDKSASKMIKTPYLAYSTSEGIYMSAAAAENLWGIDTDKSYISVISGEQCCSIDYISSIIKKTAVLENNNVIFE